MSASPAPTSLGMPADVVLRIVALLPARVARLVSRAARDAADGAVESLELEWRGPSVWVGAFGSDSDEGPRDSLGTLEALLKRPFAHLERLEFRDGRGISCVASFLQALCTRETRRPLRPLRPLRQLSVSGTSAASALALALALALESLPRPLERLDISLPSLALPARLHGAIGSMARGLRELSLGHLGPLTVRPLCDVLGALTALERLELCVGRLDGVASSGPLWTALADGGAGLRRLETLSLTGNSSFDTEDAIGPAVAALPSLRSLTVDMLAPVMVGNPAAARLHLPALAALTHLCVLRHGVDAACVGQLTALRSLRAPRIGSSADGPASAAVLAALAALTALTRLELFFNYDVMPMPMPGASDERRVALPSLRILQAGTLLPLLLLLPLPMPSPSLLPAPSLPSLPSLTDLTCICLPRTRSEVRLGPLLTGAGGRQLTSLTIYGDRFNNGPLRIGRPSELGALTLLSSSARRLRPQPRAWLPWLPWPLPWSGRGRGRGSGCSGCRLTHLTIDFEFDDDDVEPLLRGLPALTTLGLLGLSPSNVRRPLAAAFAELPSLTALHLSGYSTPVADVLAAAAACPALRAGLERIKARVYDPETTHAGTLAEAVRPFAALRSVRIGT